jgi:hypothetical protein
MSLGVLASKVCFDTDDRSFFTEFNDTCTTPTTAYCEMDYYFMKQRAESCFNGFAVVFALLTLTNALCCFAIKSNPNR